MNDTVDDLIDLDRYPLDRPGSEGYARLVAEARTALADRLLCALPGFLGATGVAALRNEVRAHEGEAEFRRFSRTPYAFAPPDETTPADHPRKREQNYELSYLYGQQLDPARPVRRVYQWPGLVDFLSEVVGHRLHRSADPTYDLLITLIGPGGIHGWHFDSNEFVVSLMLEPADDGGVFEYVPNLRSPDDERYDQVARRLDGDRTGVVPVPAQAGTLLLFHGHHSLHRVSRVGGTRRRCMALLSFDHRAGQTFDNAVLRGRKAA